MDAFATSASAAVMSDQVDLDITKWKAGWQLGGKFGVSVVCPVCAHVGAYLGKKFVQGTERHRFAHHLRIKLSVKFDPEHEFGEPCVFVGHYKP